MPLRAQVMNNKGAVIVVKPAGFMQVNGDYRNYSAGDIDDSGIVTITTHFTNDAAAFSGGSGWYNIGGNFTNNGTFTRKTGTVNLNGAANQNVGGTTITTFYDLQFTNGGPKTLTQKEIVDSNCYFTNGVCYTTQTNVLNFTTNGNWVNNSGMPTPACISYVDGPCEKDNNSTTRFWYPVGKSSRGNTCAITPQSSTATTFRTEYFNFKYWNTTSMQSPLMVISTIHYWHNDIISGGTNGISRLYWISGDYTMSVYMSTMSNLVVARWDTLAPNPPGPQPAWVTAGVSALSPGANANSGWIESAVVTAAKYGLGILNRPFTIASITADNSLPVEVGHFSAHQSKNHVLLEWKTYSEFQNLGFEIERTREADDRSSAGSKELIKSFVNDPNLVAKSPWGADYQTLDEDHLTGGRYIYDLYQIDKDGIRTLVATRFVDFTELAIPNSLEVSIYPNPAYEQSHISIAIPDDEHVVANLYDVTGKLVAPIADADLSTGEHLLDIDATNLATGSYNVVVIAGRERLMRSFVKR